MMLVVSGG